MKFSAALVAVSVCSVLTLLADADAGELRLSSNQLDLVTAGGPIFDTPGGSVSLLEGGPLSPPPTPTVPTTPPTTPSPNPNQVTFSEGGVTITILLPTNEGGPTPEVSGGITLFPGGSIGSATTRISNDSGGAVSSGGISATSFVSGS